jgi:hypothetical protein
LCRRIDHRVSKWIEAAVKSMKPGRPEMANKTLWSDRASSLLDLHGVAECKPPDDTGWLPGHRASAQF